MPVIVSLLRSGIHLSSLHRLQFLVKKKNKIGMPTELFQISSWNNHISQCFFLGCFVIDQLKDKLKECVLLKSPRVNALLHVLLRKQLKQVDVRMALPGFPHYLTNSWGSVKLDLKYLWTPNFNSCCKLFILGLE